MKRLCLCLATVFWLLLPSAAFAQAPRVVIFDVEKRVTQVPAAPLFWRLETYPTMAAAEAAAGPLSLTGEMDGRAWLFTLGRSGETSPGGTRVAEVGPVPAPPAAEYALRVVGVTLAPGFASQVHTHPGAESWYVLAGEMTLRTTSGETRTRAGQGHAGLAGGTVQQLLNTGSVALHQFEFQVLDAAQPRLTPAEFPVAATSPAPPVRALPRTGGARSAPSFALAGVGVLLATGLALRCDRWAASATPGRNARR